LKDFVKSGGHNVKFADVRDGKGLAGFEHLEDAEKALEALNNTVLKTRQGAESTVTMTLEMPSVVEETRENYADVKEDADADFTAHAHIVDGAKPIRGVDWVEALDEVVVDHQQTGNCTKTICAANS
jgi:hypothetical protein